MRPLFTRKRFASSTHYHMHDLITWQIRLNHGSVLNANQQKQFNYCWGCLELSPPPAPTEVIKHRECSPVSLKPRQKLLRLCLGPPLDMNVLQQRALSQGVRVCVCDLCSGFILKNLCSQRACSTFRLVSRTLFGVVISDDQTTYFTGEVGQSLQRLRRAINTN